MEELLEQRPALARQDLSDDAGHLAFGALGRLDAGGTAVGGGGEGQVSAQSLWWPPTKIAGRYLATYLFGRDLEAEVAREGTVEIEIPLPT